MGKQVSDGSPVRSRLKPGDVRGRSTRIPTSGGRRKRARSVQAWTGRIVRATEILGGEEPPAGYRHNGIPRRLDRPSRPRRGRMDLLDLREPVSAWSHAAGLLLSVPGTWLLWRRSGRDRQKRHSNLV